MASKLRCPNCRKMLKEEGDQLKSANGEYRVYDNLANSKNIAGRFRLVGCLECWYITDVRSFDED